MVDIGYTSMLAVSFEGGGGTGAAATVTVTGYTTAPAVVVETGVNNAAAAILVALIGVDAAQSALSALFNAGLVCVPRIPTDEMLEAGWAPAQSENAAETWREMIEAAPDYVRLTRGNEARS